MAIKLKSHKFYIGLCSENLEYLLVLNHMTLGYQIWHVASSNEPLQKLLKLYSHVQNWQGHGVRSLTKAINAKYCTNMSKIVKDTYLLIFSQF